MTVTKGTICDLAGKPLVNKAHIELDEEPGMSVWGGYFRLPQPAPPIDILRPQAGSAAGAIARSAVSPTANVSVNGLVWVAFALGLASAIPGLVLGLFGLPLGLAAAAVSAVALVRLTSKPPDQRRGETLTML